MSLAPGAHLGRYEIVGPIGAGGMGEVHRARDLTLQRDVAIKILPPAFACDADRLARFVREAQMLAALNHSNIATIYGVEESADGVHALVMELVEGDDLATLISRGPLPIEEVLPIAQQIAEALEVAHEQGIVHRDLKPANIKIRHDGAVKVLDFGLAKALHADPSGIPLADSPTVTSPAMTEHGVILGTAAYMAPEQAKGRPVDKRADIWAFGVVLYEMLSGVRPFTGDSVSEILAAVLTHDPDFAALSRNVPPAVTSLLRRCLERDPKRRLRDIGEARLLLSDTNAGDRLPPAAQIPRHPSRLLAVAAFVAVACAAGLAVAWFIGWRAADNTAGEAMTTTPITTSGIVISAAVSPDGHYVAYVESEQGLQSLWLQQLAGGQTLRLIPPQAVGYWSQTFTPDGNHIVFGLRTVDEPKGGLYSISTLGGKPKLLVKDMDSVPTYSPDGSRMAFLRSRHPTVEESALMVADADGSNPKVLMSIKLPESVAGIFFGAPAWSPDGKVIVTAVSRRQSSQSSTSEGARLVQVAVDNGTGSTLSDPGWSAAAQAGWLPDGKSLLVVARAPDQIGNQIWSVSYPGGEARRVTSGLNEHRIVSLSRDGRTLVSVADVLSLNILRMPVSGASAPVRVSRSTFDGQNGIAFAPDGALVYTSRSKDSASLWRVSADGADRGPLVTATKGEFLRFPSVTDDGTIYYVAAGRSGVEVRSTSADGSSTRVLARDALAEPLGTSADGTVVVYSSLVKGMGLLFRMAPDGSNRKAITTFGAGSVSVEPSGRRVGFYFRNALQQFRFGVASIDGGALLTDLPTEELPARTARLLLRPEGFYATSMPGDRANVWLLPLDGRPARKVTSFGDQTIFDFALSRDGATIAVVRGSRLRDAQLIRGFDSGAHLR